MDARNMDLWNENFFRPYKNVWNNRAGILLDDFSCHKSEKMKSILIQDNCSLFIISPHYTSLLQPCDIEFNKPMKERFKKYPETWR